jgi:hypothetical protein
MEEKRTKKTAKEPMPTGEKLKATDDAGKSNTAAVSTDKNIISSF